MKKVVYLIVAIAMLLSSCQSQLTQDDKDEQYDKILSDFLECEIEVIKLKEHIDSLNYKIYVDSLMKFYQGSINSYHRGLYEKK